MIEVAFLTLGGLVLLVAAVLAVGLLMIHIDPGEEDIHPGPPMHLAWAIVAATTGCGLVLVRWGLGL